MTFALCLLLAALIIAPRAYALLWPHEVAGEVAPDEWQASGF